MEQKTQENAKRNPLTDDPRVALAAERTVLAWLRTGLALMGFGFVLARFGLFFQEMAAASAKPVSSHGVSLALGIGLVVVGILANAVSAWKYRRYLRILAAGVIPKPDPLLPTLLAALLCVLGLATVVYLVALL